MPNLEIIPVADVIVEIECKRMHMPFKIASTCPECATRIELNYAESDHVSYPKIGEPLTLYFYHVHDDDSDHEWTEHVRLRLTLEPMEG